MQDLHSILKSQLLKHFGSLDKIPIELLSLVETFDAACAEATETRAAFERLLELKTQEVQRANADLRVLFQVTSDISFRLAQDGTILDYKAGTVVDPYYKGDMRGRKIQDVPTPVVGVPIEGAIARLKKSEAPVCIEYAMAVGSNKQFYEARLMSLVDNQVICIVRNVTQQKQTSEALHRRNEAIIRYQTALLDMAEVSEEDLGARLKQVVSVVARILPAKRVSVWWYNREHTAIVCEVLYTASMDSFSKGMELQVRQCPRYFVALAENRLLAVSDAMKDPRTSGFGDYYLKPRGVTALLDVPIRVRGEVIGVLCAEHTGSIRDWNTDEQEFAAYVANMITLTIVTSERRKAEHEREHSLSLQRATLEATTDGILVVDTAGRIVSYSQRFADLWRLPPEIRASRDDHRLMAFILDQLKDPESYLDKIREVQVAPDRESFDVLQFRDGRVFERHGRPQRIGGQCVGRVWSFRDVTHRILAEQALQYRVEFEQLIARLSTHFINLASDEIDGGIRHAMQAIGEFEHLDRCSVYALDPGITVLSLTHQWVKEGVSANHPPLREIQLAGLPGLSRKIRDLESVQVPDAACMPWGEERDALLALGFRSFALIPMLSGRVMTGVLCFETVNTTKAWGLDVLALLQMAADILINALKRKETEEALKKSDEQLRHSQKMDAVGRLAGGIAHDFNNLLTSIIGFGDLALQRLEPGHAVRGDLGEILSAAQRAERLTSQLLTMGRKQMLRVKRMDVNALVLDMDTLLRRTLGEDIEILTTLSEHPVWIDADVSQIEQIIMNVAVNAREAMPRGGTLRLETSVLRKEKARKELAADLEHSEYVVLTVADNGCGMPPHVRERAFEPFFTTKTDGKGTGLGLATVYAIVQAYDGHIELDSEPGKGTAIRAGFPRAQAPVVTAAHGAPSRVVGGTETILLVEDESSVRALASRILSALGYRIIIASNGCEALKLFDATKGSIDLVLTDVVMPQMGGPELIKKLHGGRNRFKVLYASGYPGSGTSEFDPEADHADVLPKPYTRETLAKKVREVLDGIAL